MTPRRQWMMLAVALVGVGVCVAMFLGFVATVRSNNLPWSQGDLTVRDYYFAVGQSFSQGFTVGFFLCLFLTMVALSLRAWILRHRETVRLDVGSDPRVSREAR